MTDEEVLKGVIYPSISRYKMAFIISYCVLSRLYLYLILKGFILKLLCMSINPVHICSIRDITKQVAAAVIKEAIEEDLAEGYREMDSRELRKLSQVYLVCNSIALSDDVDNGIY